MLGAFIKAQRQMADLSLRQLSAQSNVSNAYLSQIERGLHQPSVAVLRAIAEALNVSSETLLAQAGFLDSSRDSSAKPVSVETAINADASLSLENKRVLLGVYRSLRTADADAPASGTPQTGAKSADEEPTEKD